MANIDITDQGGGSLSNGVLQLENGVAMDTTLRYVADQANTKSQLLLATNATTVEGTLKVKTNNVEYLDVEDGSGNNRFTISRPALGQKVTLDFASNPVGSTTIVGAIRTFTDGTNLNDIVQFREDGQTTFVERVNVEADSLVTTQTSSVIASTTTNANLVIAPNGIGALVANIPDGTVTGGNARGAYAVDLQLGRGFSYEVASGNFSFTAGYGNRASGQYSIAMGNRNWAAADGSTAIGGGSGAGEGVNAQAIYSTAIGGKQNNATGQYSGVFGGQTNTASSNHSTISGGQSNTASTNTHATVVGGQSNTSSGAHSVSGGQGNTASGIKAISFGESNTNSASYSFGIGFRTTGYLYGQFQSGSGFFAAIGDAQQSLLTARREDTLTTGLSTVLSLDGTGVTNLIIPNGNNRLWNVVASWSAVVTNITGTATGVSIGDVATECNLFAFKKIGGVSSIVGTVTNVASHNDASMATAAMGYTAGGSQELVPTFSAPTFAGGGSVTIRVVLKLMLTEVAY
jgi:hypothetical protein